MSAAKEEAPGGQTGGPVRSRQSADNGPVISSSIADNDDGSAPFRDKARQYFDLGYLPIPIESGTKGPPPEGFTGYDGTPTDKAQIEAWIAKRGGDSIALRLPETVLGIDVDAYDDKTGRATFTGAQDRLGPLPETVHTSADSDGISGIYYYRVPAGRQWANTLGPTDSGVEIIHHGHRYAMAPNSLNPRTGTQYRVLDRNGNPCDMWPVDDLPELPQAWVWELDRGSVAERAQKVKVSSQEADNYLAELLDGPMSKPVSDTLETALEALKKGKGSRHDTMVPKTARLVRLGEQGHIGAPSALRQLETAFKASLADDPSRDANEEWDRSITGAVGIVQSEPSESIDDVFDDLPPLEDDFDEDRDVWERREILTRHRDWAKARQASPQAVLGFSLARSAAAVPPAYILPPTIMGHASLNLFVAISSDSGGGKSGALQVSKQALKIATPEPEPYVQQPLGSGEGLMQNFVRHEKESFKDEDGKTKTTKRIVQHTERVLSVVDEIGHLIGMTQRSGQTLTSTLRSAWSGAGLGFGYSKDDNRLEVPEHRYRQCVAAGVQTKAAGGLLSEEEEALGTPQRFVWLRAVDDRGIIDVDSIPDPPERIVWNAPAGSITGSFGRSDGGQPEGLKPPDEDPTGWVVFTICETAKRKIREDHAISNNPEGAALMFSPERIEAAASGIERHLNLSRLKIAAILRLWEDPQDLHINDDDWELAGNIIKLSQRELGRIQAELRKLAEKQDRARGSRAGRQEVAKQEVLDDEDQKRQARAAQAVLNKLKALDGEWISASALKRAVRKNHRGFLPDALEDLVNTGQAEPQEIEYNGQTGTRYRYVGAG